VLQIHLPEADPPGVVDPLPALPATERSPYIHLKNTYDFPVRVTIHTVDPPRPVEISPGETEVLVGRMLLHLVQIEALPREES
jgi:hypothetical protein